MEKVGAFSWNRCTDKRQWLLVDRLLRHVIFGAQRSMEKNS